MPNPGSLECILRRAAAFLAAALLAAHVAAAWAQTPAPGTHRAESAAGQKPEAPPVLGVEPSQDIFIEGIGFSKLVLVIEPPRPAPQDDVWRRAEPLLEKNLCWSGLFNLSAGTTRYCALAGDPKRVDMRLALSVEDGQLRLRLKEGGPEALVLFEASLKAPGKEGEREIMETVNRLTEKITGQPGILGTTLAFSLRQPRYAKVIVATDTHGRPLQPLSANRDINLLPRWSPSGTSLVYTVLTRDGTHVYFQNIQPEANGLGPSRFLTALGTLHTGGAFSPDGKKLIMTLNPNDNADLFEYDLTKNRQRQLTSRLGIETQADWAKDGSKVVFVSDRSGTPQVYLLDMETTEDLRLTFDGGYNADPRFSPDGRLILFTKRVNEIEQIHIMDVNGENVRQVTRGRFVSKQADWSPDGHQLVFTANLTGEFKLYLVSTDGSNLRRLTDTPAGFDESNPTWTRRRMFR